MNNVSGLVDHLKGKHDLPIDTIIPTFKSFCEFIKWKEEEMHDAPKIITDYQHYYYYCNRAGVYKSRGIGKRAKEQVRQIQTVHLL